MPEAGRVLIVDDDGEIVRGLTIRMRAAGYEVLTAWDGQAGLTAAVENRPDAIILDIRMPVMDGLEVLAKLREQTVTKSIPVVVISANAVERTRAKALDLGARCFLVKPYQAGTLIAAVKSVLKDPITTR
jgi:DNA-binding response OmpR family regulator